MRDDIHRSAVLALHWQVNVIEPQGVFGPLLAEPVLRSGVVKRAADFHRFMRSIGVPVYFTRFVVPEDEGQLVRNTAFMEMVGAQQERFRPDGPGAELITEMREFADPQHVVDNQKLSGLAGNHLPDLLAARGIDTVHLTGVATNLTVEQTARHATDLGLTVRPVSDCTAAADEDVHGASLANLDLTTRGLVTSADVRHALG
ncbi:cysteine hydrolase [Nocardiopsis ganjiahuensis]|uniref:cysteine hydrolase n=1 Tax=Nocardiopsis ganjiahuensis TaxID=239984 RepID=UPI000345EDD5|nr:cysteine hydrolase [Nocardiopsis ganjiahuensis]